MRERRNLRGDIEKRSLYVNEQFESSFREVKEVKKYGNYIYQHGGGGEGAASFNVFHIFATICKLYLKKKSYLIFINIPLDFCTCLYW